jgi:hypothetical protein
MIQLTTLSWVLLKMNLTMTESTLQRRTEQLIAEINVHPHKEELLQLMYEQRCDSLLDEYTTILN